MKFAPLVVMMAAILAVILASGCTSAPVEETSASNDRYVEINLLDGTKVCGKFVSETAAFTTILVMYTMDPDARVYYTSLVHLGNDSYTVGPRISVKDPDKYLVKGNGAEVSIKNSLINTMVTIDEPTPMIEATLKELDTIAATIKNSEEGYADAVKGDRERIDERARIAEETRDAKRAKPN